MTFARKRSFTRRTHGFSVARIVKDGYGELNDWRALRAEVGKRDDYKCRKCGADVSNEPWDCHHIIPISRGGVTATHNLMCVCERCHSRQHVHMSSPRALDNRKKSTIFRASKTRTRIR